MTEDKLQTTCFQWFWNNYPEKRGQLFHVNQKAKNAIEGNRMKAMGVVSGVSDLVYLQPEGIVTFIEMKTETGYQRPDQKKFEALVTRLGFTYIICRTFEDFKQIVCN